MEFILPEIQRYAEAHTSKETPLLEKINRDTYVNVLKPRMLSGHMQGRILSMFSHMMAPKNILEIGTYTGYSALCLAEGLQKNGNLITLDINEELAQKVRGYFNDSPYREQIDYRIGDALEILPTLKGPFDLVFIDADKENYAMYFDLLIDKVRTGGIIIADNVIWSGKVIKKTKKDDKDTAAIKAFNQKVHTDERVENVLLPVRDGLMLIRKIT
jgi:caffeoyl-CoA O-methyltransferase